MQELAEDVGGNDAMHSARKGSKGRGATSKVATVSENDKLYLLTLHEQHHLDAPDARERSHAVDDELAGMQQTGGKGRWVAPALPMCAADSLWRPCCVHPCMYCM